MTITADRVREVTPLIGLMRDVGSAHGAKTPAQVRRVSHTLHSKPTTWCSLVRQCASRGPPARRGIRAWRQLMLARLGMQDLAPKAGARLRGKHATPVGGGRRASRFGVMHMCDPFLSTGLYRELAAPSCVSGQGRGVEGFGDFRAQAIYSRLS